MKISEQWLREWINPALTTAALAEQFAMLGLTIDAVIPVAKKFTGVVVGEVIARIQHPNADKLSCCTVSVGSSEPLKIVCGASNARAGIKVAVATVGAVLPGDFKIKEAKLRGELSQGMLCSAKELGLHCLESDGIIELPQDATAGDDFNAYFKAQDHIFDVEITPNRGDCLSIRGLARDMAAAHHLPTHAIAIKKSPVTATETLSVHVDAKVDCPRYVGRIITGINNKVETPSWMQQCLQRAGVRLINPVVDVCNYVMFELGQPMHAFDLAALQSALHVRRAKSGEKITLLDENTVTLTPADLVIADDHAVHALAGIMGGKESAVSLDTKNIFLEAAFFDPKTICLSKRRHNTNSDSSYRFERGVDFNLPVDAIERATELLIQMVGGSAADIIEVTAQENLPKRDKITLEKNEIERILGVDIQNEKVENILKSLDMSVKSVQNGWEVLPPSFRFDVTLPIDLIEELARMINYNTISMQPMIAPLAMHPKKEARVCDKQVRHFLVSHDYHEAMTYSFISPELHALFAPNKEPMVLKNPLSQDLSVMRVSILPGLLQALTMNVRHQCERVRLFEMGLCFETKENGELLQSSKLAMVITGSVNAEQWSEKSRAVDFYDLKAEVTALLSLSHLCSDYHWKVETHPALHPGRSAALYRNNELMGWLGEVHPNMLTHFDMRQSVVVCELDLKKIQESDVAHYESFSRFPSVRRDLAIVLDESVSADTIRSSILKKAGKQLQDLLIFDVYQGRGIETGKKSIALGLTFQDPTRTLRDEEINEVIHGVVAMLQQELKATLRA
ncbi:MAG: phenylalanine--tRNA ligase subunit beta [Gammaproteobacteria bacterium CG_4_10_14_0_8_um_filter_38_16]|nr:MAG: phenylalanine--tRNA ligase subunit beta [Gammaproteobacteria bacterium CG_4_10_14_0_8_um_filter_38_16]PJA02690.1 MAG: phenylalanine--tRNA ligase subunit beta [Gammaproteobacteria bacterium CG_4_10_14_0_2_um_filter_38_22]PJB09525.1 MAG: phenylalanine--tRNA ligase subunit beta [Gammaproteobacteria bacterium CG_4_9_14_3_um_filter_38_9]